MIFLGDKRSIFAAVATVFTTVILGCNSNEQKPVQKIIAPAKVVLTQPFRFHKVIEVSPGNIFDIFSWGRGSVETGSFLILASDSAEAKYTTTTGDLDGAITDVYNTDMDMDGNPEILIQAKSKDSTIRTQIYAFEFKGNKAQKLDFPKLTKTQKKGYYGEDNFYIKEGVLMREFPVLNEKDSTGKSDKRILEYGLRNNNFTVKTVSQEEENSKKTTVSGSDNTKNSAVVAAVPATKNTSQKKHHDLTTYKRTSAKKTNHKSSKKSTRKHRRHRR